MSKTGMVFDIQRTSLMDGPGLRTTVFLKGCPIRCAWCHNPESQKRVPELSFRLDRCLQCRRCVTACDHGVHRFDEEGRHQIDRAHCRGCAQCVEHCPGDALQIFGHEQTVDSVLEVVMKDVAFYRQSGGGMTLSGGEPLFQPEFAMALLIAAREQGIHTCVETCGHVLKDLLVVLPYHNAGRDKYERLGRTPSLHQPSAERSQVEQWVSVLRQQTGRSSINLVA